MGNIFLGVLDFILKSLYSNGVNKRWYDKIIFVGDIVITMVSRKLQHIQRFSNGAEPNKLKILITRDLL